MEARTGSGAKPDTGGHDAFEGALEECRTALWSRFVDRHGIVLDCADERGGVDLPDPEDCRLGRPNSIGWSSPIANGAFFTGVHLYGLCLDERPSPVTIERKEKLARGLLALGECSEVPGFIGRGLGTDGRCHYPTGSDDQTHPWFLGLGAFLLSGGATGSLRREVEEAVLAKALDLDALDWKIPCDGAFKGQFRGDLRRFEFRPAAQLLFILRLLHELTGERRWEERYAAAREERESPALPSRRRICSAGCLYDLGPIPDVRTQMWIVAGSQISLSHLGKADPSHASDYLEGIAANRAVAAAGLSDRSRFDPADRTPFRLHAWRTAFPAWKPQRTQEEARALSQEQIRDLDRVDAPGESRRFLERRFVQQPLAAAAVAAIGGVEDRDDPIIEEIRSTIVHYPYPKLHASGFVFGDLAGCLLKAR